MATYKVLQDIEAEDKLLGPLTLKQFIFAIITIAIGFIEFKLATTTQLSVVRWPFVIVLLLPMLVFGFLAAPISRDQPNDIWLLARLRFLLKPHTRIWNQDGLSQLVTITVPKRIERVMTNGLNQSEVQSRLTALASTLDSRGWAIKNVDVNMFAQPSYLAVNDNSDRLVAPSTLPIVGQATDVRAADDILDATNNPIAQHLDQMVQASTAQHQQQVRQNFQNQDAGQPAATADYWFLNQQSGGAPQVTAPQGYATFQNSQVVAPGSVDLVDPEPTAEEKALIEKIEAEQHEEQHYNSHLKTIQPLADAQQASQPAPTLTPVDPYRVLASAAGASDPLASSLAPTSTTSQTAGFTPTPTSASTPNPAILNLANNDDLNVATIARQAKRISEADDEVVISLH